MIARDFFHPGGKRQEIPRLVKIAVWNRVLKKADGDPSRVACEKCGLILGKKAAQYDHILSEVLNPLTGKKEIGPDDVKYLGLDCCHKNKSAEEVHAVSKTKRLSEQTAQAKEKKPKESKHKKIRERVSPLYKSR